MEPRAAARALSLARVAIGAGLLAAPRLATPLWIGRRALSPAAKLLTRGLGARDAAIGLGVLAGVRSGAELRPWIVAGMLADATDLLATVVQRDDLPATALPLVAATAGPGLALGAMALRGGGAAPVPA